MVQADGRMLEELDRLELGPDPAGAWDDAWLDDDGELSAAPGWEAWGVRGACPPLGSNRLARAPAA
jgi:hypothetical protein